MRRITCTASSRNAWIPNNLTIICNPNTRPSIIGNECRPLLMPAHGIASCTYISKLVQPFILFHYVMFRFKRHSYIFIITESTIYCSGKIDIVLLKVNHAGFRNTRMSHPMERRHEINDEVAQFGLAPVSPTTHTEHQRKKPDKCILKSK